MSKHQLAEEYCNMKQAQAQGGFTKHELFLIKFAFMAGYDACDKELVKSDLSSVDNITRKESSIPDYKGERVITWDYLEKRSEPSHHLHFEWRCPYCNTMNDHDTTIPHGLAEIICQEKECEAFMYLEKLTES